MRTFRELFGWGLLLVAWLMPPLALLLLGLVADDRLPPGALFFAAMAVLLMPRLILSAHRLREPDPADVAEADGRRPVILMHAFARSREPLWTRLFALQPGLWRDVADERLERAIVKGLSDAGPVVPFARRPVPPDHGPMKSLEPDAGWAADLEARLRAARMAVIVLDGSEDNLVELELASASVGLDKTVLVTPSKIDGAFLARWASLREKLPGLPNFDSQVAAARWAVDGSLGALSTSAPGLPPRLRLLRQPGLMLREGEARPGPRAPSVGLLLPFLPLLGAFFSAVSSPIWADEVGRQHLPSEVGVGLGFGTMLLGVVLAVMSRRFVRLVPGNELPALMVATLPWWGLSSVVWAEELSRGHARTHEALKVGALGATYSAPLLFSLAVVLAGATLVRGMPERRPAYAVFGVALTIPFAAFYLSLAGHGDEAVWMGMSLLVSAGVFGLVAIAASGDAGRRHAPLPIGAAVAATLATAATAYAAGGSDWRRVLDGPIGLDAPTHAHAVALQQFASAWPWLAWVLPLAAALIALQFRGRVTRVSIGSVASLAALILVTLFASHGEREAWASYEGQTALLGEGLYANAAGAELTQGFSSLRFEQGSPVADVDVVVDPSGALARGRRVAQPADLAGWGGPGLNAELSRAVGASGEVRIAPDERADALTVVRTTERAFEAGARQVLVVGRDPEGRPVALRVHPPGQTRDPVSLFLRVMPGRAVLLDDAGTPPLEAPLYFEGRLDTSAVSQHLFTRRQMEPNRARITLLVSPGLSAQTLFAVASVASRAGYFDLALAGARP